MVTQRKVQDMKQQRQLNEDVLLLWWIVSKDSLLNCRDESTNMKHVEEYKTMNRGMYAETSNNNSC